MSLEEHNRNIHGQKRKRQDKKPLSEVDKERKLHMETKKELEALKNEYKHCKEELMIVQEEKERLNIKVKDFKAIIDISSENNKDIDIVKETENLPSSKEICMCNQCDFPFSTIDEQNKHAENHKILQKKSDVTQKCNICKQVYDLNSDFRSHILMKHQSDFNCQECDFQAGPSQIILSKHMNLRHRKESEQINDTFKCEDCNMQFSSKWTFNNHKRDKHERKPICKFYNQGDCRFPEKDCWNRHTKSNIEKTQTNEAKAIECYVCKNTFKTKHEMMLHRKNNHQDRVRPCKDELNCGFTKCWYIHSTNDNTNLDKTNIEKNVEGEHLNKENFQGVPTPPEPPSN